MRQKFTSYREISFIVHKWKENRSTPGKIIVTFEIARKYLYIGCYSLRVWVAIKTCQLIHIRQLKSRRPLFDVTKLDLNLDYLYRGL